MRYWVAFLAAVAAVCGAVWLVLLVVTWPARRSVRAVRRWRRRRQTRARIETLTHLSGLRPRMGELPELRRRARCTDPTHRGSTRAA
jgi:hypothetical protein